MTAFFTPAQLNERLIAFNRLSYSTDAFIDYRIPGCGPKKNYALIGPGVSQNPNQPVSLREQHGFQVGGVSMPPGVVNPPHMHFTAEVFICASGRWQLHWGFNPEPHTAAFGEGDLCSMPTWIYRGFKNTGTQDGFMFTALGGNDTGGILWGPATLAAAREQGVHLTEDYEIIDEHLGGVWGAHHKRLQPMTTDEIAALRSWSASEMAQRVVRFADLAWSSNALLDAALPGCGAQMAAAIGHGMSADRNHLAPIMNAHGFSVEWLKIPVGGAVSLHHLACQQVLICKAGCVEILVLRQPGVDFSAMKYIVSGASGDVRSQSDGHTSGHQIGHTPSPALHPELGGTTAPGWDSYAMPAGAWRRLRNAGVQEALLVLMTPGDGRKTVTWSSSVVQAAAAAGYCLDANGYVAPKRFVDRSQR